MTVTWQVQDDIKNKDDEGKITYTRGPIYEMKMSESDQKLYRGATVLSWLLILTFIALVLVMVL